MPSAAKSSAPAAKDIQAFDEALQTIINAPSMNSVAKADAINQLIKNSELPVATRFRFTNHVLSEVETRMGTDVSDLLRDPGPPGSRFTAEKTLTYRANEDVHTFACSAEQGRVIMCARHHPALLPRRQRRRSLKRYSSRTVLFASQRGLQETGQPQEPRRTPLGALWP